MITSGNMQYLGPVYPVTGVWTPPRRGGGSGPNPPIPPNEIPGLQVWLRSDVVVLTGDTVLSWLDQSGNGRHLNFPSGREATYSLAGGVNGLPKLIFTNSSGGSYATATPIFDTTVGLTAVSVSKNIPAGVFPEITNIQSQDANKDFRAQVVPSLPGYLQLTASITAESSICTGLSDYYDTYYQTLHYLMTRYNGAGANTPTNWVFTINAVDMVTATDANALASGLGGSSVGTPGTGTPDFDPGGDWYEYFVYDHPLTPEEKAGLQAYLYQRYTLGAAPMLAVAPAAVEILPPDQNFMMRNRAWIIGASIAAAGLGALAYLLF